MHRLALLAKGVDGSDGDADQRQRHRHVLAPGVPEEPRRGARKALERRLGEVDVLGVDARGAGNRLLLQRQHGIIQKGGLRTIVHLQKVREGRCGRAADHAIRVQHVTEEQLCEPSPHALILEACGPAGESAVHQRQHLQIVPDPRKVSPRAHEVHLLRESLGRDLLPNSAALEAPNLEQIRDHRSPLAVDDAHDELQRLDEQLRPAVRLDGSGLEGMAGAAQPRAEREQQLRELR
mmetsp:Transcript_90477/g.258861  ORF Transcript_90477/g.258861 Transcript_90477/m.258861 type:complete len:236 (-) Transcript_90477:568-1275(-)